MIRLTRSISHYMVDEPLTWKPVAKAIGGRTATVVCSNGHSGLIDHHLIANNGKVLPSVVCTEKGCGWHEFVHLEGWKEEQNDDATAIGAPHSE